MIPPSNHGRTSAKSILRSLLVRLLIVPRADFLLDPNFVLSQARAMDCIPEDHRGPLYGLAVGVKDVMSTEGIPLYLSVCGTRAYVS